MKDIYAQMTWGIDAAWYCAIYDIQGIICLIDWGSICLLYIGIVLDLAVGVVLCKSSMLKWLGVHSMHCLLSVISHLCSNDWGVHLPSIYRHYPRSSSGCSSMQGICAQLTGGVHLPSIYMHCPRSSSGCSGMAIWCSIDLGWSMLHGIVLANVFGVVVNSHMLDWLRGICLLYICIVLDLVVGVVVCKASVLNWLYICIVLDLALGVVVCMASVLNWLGRATWSVMVFKYIYAWLTRGSICLLYICIVIDLAMDVADMQGICALIEWGGPHEV